MVSRAPQHLHRGTHTARGALRPLSRWEWWTPIFPTSCTGTCLSGPSLLLERPNPVVLNSPWTGSILNLPGGGRLGEIGPAKIVLCKNTLGRQACWVPGLAREGCSSSTSSPPNQTEPAKQTQMKQVNKTCTEQNGECIHGGPGRPRFRCGHRSGAPGPARRLAGAVENDRIWPALASPCSLQVRRAPAPLWKDRIPTSPTGERVQTDTSQCNSLGRSESTIPNEIVGVMPPVRCGYRDAGDWAGLSARKRQRCNFQPETRCCGARETMGPAGLHARSRRRHRARLNGRR
eukprot:gene25223-biopygen4486